MQLRSDFGVSTTIEIMSAMKLNIQWLEFVKSKPVPVSPVHSAKLARLGVEPEAHQCPCCNSPVYSRRLKVCGVCGNELPREVRFTLDESERVDQLLKTERERHRRWLRRTAA
jgi:hypothetical protein